MKGQIDVGGGWRRGTAAWIAAWMRAYPHRVADLVERSGVRVGKIRVLSSEGPTAIYQAVKVAQALRSQRLVKKACRIAENWEAGR